MKRLSLFLFVLVSSLSVADVLPSWSQDYAAAVKQAQAEKKDILINFSGSDWCGYCELLSKEILETEHFKSEVPKQFVLVQADFPKQIEQSPELKEQNNQLRRKYKVRGFPTLVLTDAKGTLYLTNGYREQTPEDYVAWLRQAPVIRDIDAFAVAEKFDDALKAIDAFRKSEKPFADILQHALVSRATIFERQGKSKAEVIAALEDAIAADPQSPVAAQLRKIIAELQED